MAGVVTNENGINCQIRTAAHARAHGADVNSAGRLVVRILLMSYGLGAGGAERVLVRLGEWLESAGHDVHLLTLTDSDQEFFRPGDRVGRIRLGVATRSSSLMGGLWANLHRIRAIRREVLALGPRVVVSFTTTVNILALLACVGTDAKVIVSERVDPREHRLALSWRILRRVIYPRAHAVVVQTLSVREWFRRRLPAGTVVEAIGNPVTGGAASEPTQSQRIPEPFILAVGRLVRQKGFDVLLRAFSLVLRECPELYLAIAGTGPERAALLGLAKQLHIDSRVCFLGQVSNVRSLMTRAHAFALSSRYEGFPNVLLEAMVSGIPLVSTDCRSGPREMLKEGECGLLVPPDDPGALAVALTRLAKDDGLRERLRSSALRRAADFAPEVVLAAWGRLLHELGEG